MNNHQLKAAFIKKLHEQTGKKLLTSTRMVELCEIIGRTPRPGLTPSRILKDYLGIERPEPKPYVNPPYRPAFKPLAVPKHPRLADIERAQPPMTTPAGTGNYNQYTQYMMDNGRSR